MGYVPVYFMSQTEAIVPATYLVMNIVLVAILSVAVLFDAQFSQKKFILSESKLLRQKKLTLLLRCCYVASLSAIGNFLTIDRSLLAGGVEKTDLLANNTYFYNFWVYTSLLALFFSYCLGRKVYFVIAFSFLLLDTYFYAMRVHIVLALMAIIFHWLYSKGPVRLISKINYGLLFSPLILFLCFQSLMRPLNEGIMHYSLKGLLILRPICIGWFELSFNQTAILNKTVTQDFVSPPSHLLMSIVSMIPYSGSIDFGIHQRFHIISILFFTQV